MAEGVLICAVGREATKKISLFLKSDKQYVAKIELGKTSDTYDKEGEIKNICRDKSRLVPTLGTVKIVLKRFVGETKQTPPIFSAKRIKGKRAYDLARAGKKVELKPVKIKINKIKILSYKWPFLKIEVDCGSGTYVRSLANGIGEKLGVGGILVELKRTKVKNINIKKAIKLEILNEKNWERKLVDIEKMS